MAFIGGNGCREKVVTKAKNAIPIPDGVSDEVAAGIPITYGTALHALEGSRARYRQDETVAVLGAAGGAGLAAVEMAKLMGARVIASPRRARSSPSPARMAPNSASTTRQRISRAGSRR